MSMHENETSPSEGLDRRAWMKQTATLTGIGAALAATGCGTNAPAPAAAAAPAPAGGPAHGTVATPDGAVVATTAGKVRGFTRNGVFIFKGIPYGDTTAGENRFQAPKPVKPWTDVRPAVAWGPVSPHGPRAGWVNQEEQFLLSVGRRLRRRRTCCALNVWTPAVNGGATKRPVLVWIHGGGYASGSSQELRAYDGERLAREHDVVLVSMNHRLNVFGFLDLSQIGGEPVRRSPATSACSTWCSRCSGCATTSATSAAMPATSRSSASRAAAARSRR